MRKILFVLSLMTCAILQAQYSIQGTISPDHDYSWILLYQMENGDQTYIANADVEEGQFKFDIDENQAPGIYRAYYQIENNLYVEFIYNKEEIEFSFDPSNPNESINFIQSNENTIYTDYYKEIKLKQEVIDSIQVSYFKATEKQEEKLLVEAYKESLNDLKATQTKFEKKASGLIASHFIRASAQYNSDSPHKNPNDYLDAIKSHFFDAMDLTDSVLSNSTFINDRLNDFVFYLHQADDLNSENELQKQAIQKAVDWIGPHVELLSRFEEDLLATYLSQENVEMINFVLDNFYNKLPQEYQNQELIRRVKGTLKTAIGIRAPDFKWNVDGKEHSLYSLNGTDYYIVLFFSSNCPHCQMEIPEFYKFIIGIENIKVVAIGLEDEKESWKAMTEEYEEFINILDLDKWSSQKVEDYGIHAIPTYFVLDADKNILAKPDNFEELKSLFETR